jgi:hypothetical protein
MLVGGHNPPTGTIPLIKLAIDKVILIVIKERI